MEGVINPPCQFKMDAADFGEVFHTRPGACATAVSAACRGRGVRRASSTHGSSAASDRSDHMPSETRQSKRSATGPASSAGTIVPACSTVM